MHLLEHAKLGIGSKLCVLYHRCCPDGQSSSDGNGTLPGSLRDGPVGATALLWSLIGQALVAGSNSDDEIQASVYRLDKFDRELLKKRLGDGQCVSLDLLTRLFCSVLSMRAFPETFVMIDQIENLARSEVPEFLAKVRGIINELAASFNVHLLITGTPVEEVSRALSGVRVVSEDIECRGISFTIHIEDDSH